MHFGGVAPFDEQLSDRCHVVDRCGSPGHLGELLDQELSITRGQKPCPGQDLGKQVLAVGAVHQGAQDAGSELDNLSFPLARTADMTTRSSASRRRSRSARTVASRPVAAVGRWMNSVIGNIFHR
jgi:hypothetical protein